MDSILESLLYNKSNVKDLDYIFNSSVEVNINESIATEGFITDFIKNVFSFGKIDKNHKPDQLTPYKEIIDQNGNQEIFSKAPHTAYNYLTLSPVVVDNERGIIVIRKINFELLIKHIRDSYGEKKLDSIFYRTYGSSDISKFNKKKMKRSQMKITSLISPIFFALELSILFSQLYKKYGEPKYARIATEIYNNSWLKESDNREPEPVDVTYAQSLLEPKYQLQSYQKEFIEAYPKWKARLNLRGIYNAFDQGLGKTLTALSLAMAKKIDKIYVVCPNTLTANWYNETNDYYNGRVKPFICNKTKNPDRDTRVFITNNESIKNILPYIDTTCKTMLIIDEGHNFRNLNSSRVQELLELREKLNPMDVLPMSGTPLKATPNELVPALMLIDPMFTTDAAVMYNKCFNFDNYQAMEIVTSRLGKIIYRKMKSDVLKLPNKYIDELPLEIKDPDPYLLENVKAAVMDYYELIFPTVIKDNKEIMINFVDMVKKYSTAGTLNTNWYISRICNAANPQDDFSVEQMHELDADKVTEFLTKYVVSNPSFPKSQEKTLREWEAKLIHFDQVAKGKAIGKVYPPRRTALYNALWDENEDLFITRIHSNIKKTIIFSQFRGVITHIQDRLIQNGIKCVVVYGGINTSVRAENIRKFKQDDEVRVILATSQSMGTGVTLTEASQMFFFGPPWRSADYDQCCDRLYRIGQDCDVFIWNVVLKTPKVNLSSKMEKILKWSSDMFHSAIDGTVVNEE